MNMETKIHATVRMYLKAYEQRFDNPELLQKWAKRADALYEEMHKTKYNMTYVREHLFFLHGERRNRLLLDRRFTALFQSNFQVIKPWIFQKKNKIKNAKTVLTDKRNNGNI